MTPSTKPLKNVRSPRRKGNRRSESRGRVVRALCLSFFMQPIKIRPNHRSVTKSRGDMRDFVGAENFSAALRFDLDGTPLRYVPSRPKPSGETKKFSGRHRSAKCVNGCRAFGRVSGYAARGVPTAILFSFLLPSRAVARRNAARFASLVVRAERGGGERIRRRIVPRAEREKRVVRRVILRFSQRRNGRRVRSDKVCVCLTNATRGLHLSQTLLQGGCAPVDPRGNVHRGVSDER
jgi:hypothetical protein